MTLVLAIQGVEALENGAPTTLRLVRHGAVVGRSVHADWSLPDRRNHLSSRHCEISYQDGAYLLTDRSTNGTFVNGATERLAAPHRIADGDRIVIGSYELLALGGAVAPAPEIARSGWGEWDESGAVPTAPRTDRDGGATRSAVPLPFDGGGWDTPAPLSVSSWASEAPVPSAPSAAQLWGRLAEGDPVPETPSLPPAPEPRSGWGAVDASATPLAGVAANDDRVPDGGEAAPVTARAGALMLRLIGGLAALVEARARAKAELGVVSTTIELDGNNPIKFIRAPERVMEALLNPPQPGFMPAEAAIDDAFRDIQLHEMAMAASMRAAIEQTLKRFSPAAIRERRRADGWLAKLLPQARAAALWRAYEDEFEGVVRDADEAFMDLFGKAFRAEYARCLDAAAARPRR